MNYCRQQIILKEDDLAVLVDTLYKCEGLTGARHYQIHLTWTKWPPFPRRYFQMHFRRWKVLYFD